MHRSNAVDGFAVTADEVISQRRGHASIGFTLDTYAHVLPAADEQTANTLALRILGETA